MMSIGVVALGAVEDAVLSPIASALEHAYLVPVRMLLPLPEPSFAYDAQRGQFSSVLVLRQLLGQASESTIRLLGVTEKDLFIPMLSFVLGQAQLNGPTAVISLARLRQEYYGFPPDPELLVLRAMKEAVHEIGHTFGLTHCTDTGCPMSLSNNIRHVDAKGKELCTACATRFDEQRSHSPMTNDRTRAAGNPL
jgi:archaemetzincin